MDEILSSLTKTIFTNLVLDGELNDQITILYRDRGDMNGLCES